MEPVTYSSGCEWDWRPFRRFRSYAPLDPWNKSDFKTTRCSYSAKTERGAESLETVYKTFVRQSDETSRRDNQQHQQRSIDATLVRSREPSVSRAQVVLGRAPSPSRSLRVITRSQSREDVSRLGRNDRLLTVTPTPDSQAEYKTFQSEVEPGRLPPARPGKAPIVYQPFIPHHRATSLPRTTPGSSITQNIPPVANTQTSGFSFNQRSSDRRPVVVPIKPFEMPKQQTEVVEFRVRNVNAPKQVWKPSDHFVGTPRGYTTNDRPSKAGGDDHDGKAPARFYWELMENQPDHIPGYVDPLIVDDTQGDFGGNPIIHPERDLYADSNFYKTKDAMYPTIPEQMRLCRMISGILEAPDAMRSRGGKMYHKRKQGAERWSREAMGRKYEPPYEGLEAVYGRPYDGINHWPSRMKENLTVDELERLEHNTENLSKHDLLPPVVAFDINSALKNSRNHGKGVDIYRRNQERAEQFTIDENNRQRVAHSNKLDTQLDEYTQYLKTYKSPWNAASEGNLDRAFSRYDPCAAQSVRDEPDLRKDENTHALNYDHQKATFGVKYKPVAPVHAPRGPSVLGRHLSSSTSAIDKIGRPEPRLARMIAVREDEKPTFDTYTYKWCVPSYYGRDLMSVSADERMTKSQQGSAGWYKRPYESQGPYHHSMTDLTLRRPKDYIRQNMHHPEDDNIEYRSTPELVLGPAPNLRRPRDFQEQEYYSPLSVVTTPYNTSYMGGSRQATPLSHQGISVF